MNTHSRHERRNSGKKQTKNEETRRKQVTKWRNLSPNKLKTPAKCNCLNISIERQRLAQWVRKTSQLINDIYMKLALMSTK